MRVEFAWRKPGSESEFFLAASRINFGGVMIAGSIPRATKIINENKWKLLGMRGVERNGKLRHVVMAQDDSGLIIDKPSLYANVLAQFFRVILVEMCKCAHDCCHKRFQAKAKALNRIFIRYVSKCDQTTKLEKMKQLRTLYSRHEVVDVELVLDWIDENGLPGNRAASFDVLQWAVANDFRNVLSKAKEKNEIELNHTKSEIETTEKITEAAAASSESDRQLSIFKKEYATIEARRQKIAAEIAQVRIEFGKPELEETDALIAYAIGRICRRIEMALTMLETTL